jgi:hypothetical protein
MNAKLIFFRPLRFFATNYLYENVRTEKSEPAKPLHGKEQDAIMRTLASMACDPAVGRAGQAVLGVAVDLLDEIRS